MQNTPHTDKKLPEAEAPGQAMPQVEGGDYLAYRHGEIDVVLYEPGERCMHAWLSVVDLVRAEYERLIHGRSL